MYIEKSNKIREGRLLDLKIKRSLFKVFSGRDPSQSTYSDINDSIKNILREYANKSQEYQSEQNLNLDLFSESVSSTFPWLKCFNETNKLLSQDSFRVLSKVWYQVASDTPSASGIDGVKSVASAISLLVAQEDALNWSLENTGLVFPNLFNGDGLGSSSSQGFPGIIVVPGNAPPIATAECLIHESLHHELYYYELINGPLLERPSNVLSPWRGMIRPAELVIHGAYVFTLLLGFQIRNKCFYEKVSDETFLPASGEKKIRLNNMDEVVALRKLQVLKAISVIREQAPLSKSGEYVLSICEHLISFHN